MPPVADIERRVGQHEVCTQVRVLIAGEGITVFAPEVVVHPWMARFIAASRQVVGLDS